MNDAEFHQHIENSCKIFPNGIVDVFFQFIFIFVYLSLRKVVTLGSVPWLYILFRSNLTVILIEFECLIGGFLAVIY